MTGCREPRRQFRLPGTRRICGAGKGAFQPLPESSHPAAIQMKITSLDVRDIRFPTSLELDGSDAMHASPDYSCAYVTLETDSPDGLTGCGLTFTNGRGTEVVVAAVRALAPFVVGRTLEEITTDMRGFWRTLASEDQLRWLGPEKGVIHLATGVIVNAVWDLWAKTEGKPLFRLLADLDPQQIVNAIDFRYIEDALSPAEALELLTRMRGGRGGRDSPTSSDSAATRRTRPRRDGSATAKPRSLRWRARPQLPASHT